jgi:hypothetical protein
MKIKTKIRAGLINQNGSGGGGGGYGGRGGYPCSTVYQVP